MNKSAREMFEDLGFNYRTEIYKDDELIEIKFSGNDGAWERITKERIEYVECCNRRDLPLKFLKPTNKLMKELGWLDE